MDRIDGWGRHLADVLAGGGRLLVAGNGGSAAQAQHLTSELVGRHRDDRPAFSAIALHAETSAVTAIVNDYGASAVFARQVEAHGRQGDVLVGLSRSGSSRNVLSAVDAARARGMTTWALTGRAPNPLAACFDDAVCVDARPPPRCRISTRSSSTSCAPRSTWPWALEWLRPGLPAPPHRRGGPCRQAGARLRLQHGLLHHRGWRPLRAGGRRDQDRQ